MTTANKQLPDNDLLLIGLLLMLVAIAIII